MSTLIRALLRSSLVCVFLSCLVACHGTLETPGDVRGSTNDGPDASPDDPSDPSEPADSTDAAVSQLACDDPVDTQDNGEHNAGQACNACHSQVGQDVYTTAGTLYDAVDGTTPVAGATIHLVDAEGKEVTLITALNGNFYTQEPMVFPVKTWAGKCPDVKEMFAPVNEAGADCNAGGCHDANFRIHLP